MSISSYKKVLKANAGLFLPFFILLAATRLLDNSLIDYLRIMAGIAIIVFLSGANLTLILQYFLKKKFEFWEFWSISLILSIIFYPLLLTFEYSLAGKVTSWFPIANALAAFLSVLIFLKFDKEKLIEYPEIKKGFLSDLFKSNFFIYFLLTISFLLFLVLSFRPLPDLDPYSWLFKFETLFKQNALNSMGARPLFSSLTYIFTSITGLKIFDFFKYIFPFFLLLVFPPLWIIARNMPTQKHQAILWLLILASPSTILYLQTPMSQLPFIIVVFFFAFFLLYSYQTRNRFFYYFSGAIMAASYLFHEAASLILLVWLIPTLLSDGKKLIFDKKTFFLLSLIIVTNLQSIAKILKFVWFWSENIFIKLKMLDINLFFPAYYTNMEGVQVGWSGAQGVIKFYSFYAGPLIIAILLILAIMLIKNPRFRSYYFKIIINNKELTVISGCFLLFFAISDILPRFPNISFLPDRAWIFNSIFIIPLSAIMISYFKKITGPALIILFCLSAASISGAIYINSQKSYLITAEQLRSAEWIKNNLPEKRLMISSAHANLLHYHAGSDFMRIAGKYYCMDNLHEIYSAIGLDIAAKEDLGEIFNDYVSALNRNISVAKNNYESASEISKKNEVASNLIKSNSAAAGSLSSAISKPAEESVKSGSIDNNLKSTLNPKQPGNDERRYYIYYAKESEKNPYARRPYPMPLWGTQDCATEDFIFNKHPEKFSEVYNNKDEIIIWEIIK